MSTGGAPELVAAAQWIERARSSLLHAQDSVRGVALEDLCFDAQQCAEKALKAALIARRIPFPFTHDIDRLITAIVAGGIPFPGFEPEPSMLTQFATTTRYPSDDPGVTPAEHSQAVRVASELLAWAEGVVESTPR